MTKHSLNRAELARMNRLIRIQDDGCWLWLGDQTSNGYGKWQRGPGHRQRVAHRICWEHYNGPIPEGHQLDHLCRNRICVNPEHLEPVTSSENIMRQDHANRLKTECINGHSYDEKNTRISKAGKRQCRECDRIRTAKRDAKKRALNMSQKRDEIGDKRHETGESQA